MTPTPDPLREALNAVVTKTTWRPDNTVLIHDGTAWNTLVGRIVMATNGDVQPAPALDVERGYTVIVSSLPALYRSWRDSPNETAALLNRMLIDAAIEWLQSYERATGRPVDEFREYSPSGDPA